MNSTRSKFGGQFRVPTVDGTTIDERENSRRLRKDITVLQHNGHDLSAGNQLVMRHANIAYALAKQYQGKGVSYDDLVSEAMLGLLHAAQEYNPARGSFTTYAWWVGRRYLVQLIRSHRRQTGVSIGTQRSMPKIWTAMNAMTQELKRPPEHEELAQRVGMPVDRLRKLLRRSQVQTTSLQAPAGEDSDETLGDLITDSRAVNPADRVELREELITIPNMREELRQALASLPITDKDRKIFTCRYRLGEPGVIMRSEARVAQMNGVSESRVSQVLKYVWWKLSHRPIAKVVTHQWLRRLPERAMVLADLFGHETIEQVFGPAELWELKPRPVRRDPMPRRRNADSVNGVASLDVNLQPRLLRMKTEAASIVLKVIDRLSVLTDGQRQTVVLRFGLHDGCRRLTTDVVAGQLKIKASSVGTQTFVALQRMREHGLPATVDVRRLNVMVDEVCQALQSEPAAEPTAPAMTVESPSSGLTVTNGNLPAPARRLLELRQNLDALSQQRRQEEEVLRLWIVGPPERFGPLSLEEIAARTGLTPDAVSAFLARTVLNLPAG